MKIKLLNVDIEKGTAFARIAMSNKHLKIISIDLFGGIRLKGKYKTDRDIYYIPDYKNKLGQLIDCEVEEETNLW